MQYIYSEAYHGASGFSDQAENEAEKATEDAYD